MSDSSETPDLSTLAARLGLSPGTISRILSGQARKYRISKKTEERVLEEARRTGMVVNQMARALRMRTTRTIGLVMPDISNQFFASMARYIDAMAREIDHVILFSDAQEDSGVEADAVRTMVGHRVDGVILAPVGEAVEALELLRNSRVPSVVIDRVVPGSGLPMVGNDNCDAARQAVLHLAKAGHRRIACIRGLVSAHLDRGRIRGFRLAMEECGLSVNEDWIKGSDYLVETAERATAELMRLPVGSRPTAIIPLGTQITLGSLAELRRMKVRVPDDVSVVGFGEQPWSGLVDPPLTTVEQPIEKMSVAAFKILFERIRNKSKEEPPQESLTLFPSRLIDRESVAAPPEFAVKH
ncbi:LacI family DNA-binding transcriptional regulator [Haloferula sp.]|uniref:LacI family DNA-binding transcriptional regulator n=1 Tax=Haloferula sp. TaxID=2497595 RepID=UPI003C76F70F